MTAKTPVVNTCRRSVLMKYRGGAWLADRRRRQQNTPGQKTVELIISEWSEEFTRRNTHKRHDGKLVGRLPRPEDDARSYPPTDGHNAGDTHDDGRG